ncbi:hypothetical protein C7M84_015816 [Penaeus vannamei]|uniref:Uncharacterized protein n=1 Tax=Penaeus vannamei TaxID=6689 RepID=A0A423SPV2_PENVA|nr:hypothetical protein C7M84_015816 [Penaeus vannamei]
MSSLLRAVGDVTLGGVRRRRLFHDVTREVGGAESGRSKSWREVNTPLLHLYPITSTIKTNKKNQWNANPSNNPQSLPPPPQKPQQSKMVLVIPSDPIISRPSWGATFKFSAPMAEPATPGGSSVAVWGVVIPIMFFFDSLFSAREGEADGAFSLNSLLREWSLSDEDYDEFL